MTKILMVVPQWSDGTAVIRSAPYLRLGYGIYKHLVGKLLSWPELYDIDVAFFQRPANQLDVHNMEACKRMGIPTIVDYDDNGFLVETHNQAHEFYSRDDKQECMRECMRLADVVTVTQPHLPHTSSLEANSGICCPTHSCTI